MKQKVAIGTMSQRILNDKLQTMGGSRVKRKLWDMECTWMEKDMEFRATLELNASWMEKHVCNSIWKFKSSIF
jgi:hypothetical protein